MTPPTHGETVSAAHTQEAQTSFSIWSGAQNAAEALQILCGGPDPTDLAIGPSLQRKEELLIAPL